MQRLLIGLSLIMCTYSLCGIGRELVQVLPSTRDIGHMYIQVHNPSPYDQTVTIGLTPSGNTVLIPYDLSNPATPLGVLWDCVSAGHANWTYQKSCINKTDTRVIAAGTSRNFMIIGRVIAIWIDSETINTTLSAKFTIAEDKGHILTTILLATSEGTMVVPVNGGKPF